MSTTVTSKGQVTIPKPVRDLLGIVPGSKVEISRRAVRWQRGARHVYDNNKQPHASRKLRGPFWQGPQHRRKSWR